MTKKTVDIILVSAAALSVVGISYCEYKKRKAYKSFRNTVGVDDQAVLDNKRVTIQEGYHLCTEGSLRELNFGDFNGLCD